LTLPCWQCTVIIIIISNIVLMSEFCTRVSGSRSFKQALVTAFTNCRIITVTQLLLLLQLMVMT